jgi:hypothetical protein
MSRTSPWRAWPGSASLLLGLLLVVLALAGLVAYEAVQAARSRRVTAERALRDYATFASWELIAKATDPPRERDAGCLELGYRNPCYVAV